MMAEKAKIYFKNIWLYPPKAPINAEIKIRAITTQENL